MRGNDHHIQVVNLLELFFFRLGRARHARQLAVHAEIILERDRRVGQAFALNVDAFLRLDRLVQPFAVAAAIHQAAGELVDDDDLRRL